MSRQAELLKHQLKAGRCLREAARQSSENDIGQAYTIHCFVFFCFFQRCRQIDLKKYWVILNECDFFS
jgi:hypothetical protein